MDEQPPSTAEVVRSAPLDADATIRVRHASRADLEGVLGLYSRLSEADLERRFFSAHRPPDSVIRSWLSAAERGGAVLLAELVRSGDTSVVAEAGYVPLPNGDGELGITVDPAWRGWLGPWLLDALIEIAAARGLGALEAEVLTSNRPMRAVLHRRGDVVVRHPEWGHVVVAVGTDDARVPSWPPAGDGPKLLVAFPGQRWPGERAAEAAGFQLRICPGPDGRIPRCPVLDGGTCPLVEGADAVLFALPDDPESRRLAREHLRRHPDLAIVHNEDRSLAHDGELIDLVTAALGAGQFRLQSDPTTSAFDPAGKGASAL